MRQCDCWSAAIHSNTLQHTATHCNTLHHTLIIEDVRTGATVGELKLADKG